MKGVQHSQKLQTILNQLKKILSQNLASVRKLKKKSSYYALNILQHCNWLNTLKFNYKTVKIKKNDAQQFAISRVPRVDPEVSHDQQFTQAVERTAERGTWVSGSPRWNTERVNQLQFAGCWKGQGGKLNSVPCFDKGRTKTDINRRAISELREDINALEMQIHKCDTHITELIRENEGLKRTCHNRDNEIASLISGNQELDKKNASQYELNKERMNQVLFFLLRSKASRMKETGASRKQTDSRCSWRKTSTFWNPWKRKPAWSTPQSPSYKTSWSWLKKTTRK